MNSTDSGKRDDAGHRVGTVLLSLLSVALAGMLAILAAKGETRRSAYYAPAVGLALAASSFAFRGGRRANAALVLTILAPCPWLGEAIVDWGEGKRRQNRAQSKQDYARKKGIPYDGRSRKEVVEDLRKAGSDAWPAVFPASMIPSVLASPAEGPAALQPLGGIANVETVYGNEEGRYLIYRSDEHGFHNPPGIWSLPGIDIAAVGDSYTHGASVPSDKNLVAAIRRRWPATLNLGYGGNGPLVELGSLLEYLPQRRPRAVLWLLCEVNDLGEDLHRESRSRVLWRYLQEGRQIQNLEARQAEIDLRLRQHVSVTLKQFDRSSDLDSLRAFAGLDTLRQLVYRAVFPTPDNWELFAAVLKAARDTVRNWQGEFYLVILPVYHSMPDGWVPRRYSGAVNERRETALRLASSLRIPVIDLEPLFEEAGQRNKFVYPYKAHFTAAGYEAIGAAIVKRLEADGL